MSTVCVEKRESLGECTGLSGCDRRVLFSWSMMSVALELETALRLLTTAVGAVGAVPLRNTDLVN